MNKRQPKTNKYRFQFDELISHCRDISSPYWQIAWGEFQDRYRKYILSKIAERASKLRPPRLARQFSETVEDIAFEVNFTLLKNDCRALREFRGLDNEHIFLAWLKMICYRATAAYLRRHYKEYYSEAESESLEFVHKTTAADEDVVRWELFEEVVASMRSSAARNSRNTERDINIYLLYVMGGFSAEMLKFNPLLHPLGDRIVDVVVNRVRIKMRSNSNLSNN